MAGDNAFFDERTARGILARLGRLERQLGPQYAGASSRGPQVPIQTRWGQTCTNSDYPTYPTSGNVVLVKFGNCEPSPLSIDSTASKNFTANDPATYKLAILENGTIPDEGTVVRLTWRDGDWWILQDSTSATKWASFWLDTATDVTAGSPVYLWCWDTWGDLSSDGIDITIGATGYGTASNPLLTMNQAGTYLFIWYWDGEFVNYSAPTTKQFTTSTAGHNHTVDIDWCWRMTAQMSIQRQASGGGSWDYGPPSTYAIRSATSGTGGPLGMAVTHRQIIHAACVDHSIAAGDKLRVQVAGMFDTPTSGTLKITTEGAWLTIIRLGDAA